jgi:pantoate--beta-alanine ligase
MIVCCSLADFQQALASLPKDCELGFVPTMGALHKGHISLVQNALKYTPHVAVSIFVNPTQFNNPGDLASYPRTVEADCRRLAQAGATIVFVPSVEDIYPEADTRVFDLGGLDKTGEGPRRPGHFNGVAQVVTRLFDIVKPKYAFFGEKDFQQLAIIRYFTKKLGYPVQIVACPTLREPDGLAMSSRNTLLTPEHRAIAPSIYKVLKNAQQAAAQNLQQIANGKSAAATPSELVQIAMGEIEKEPLLKTEYVEIVNSLNLQIVNKWDDAQDIQMCTAVYAGNVRLIDNIKLK